jgi:MFS family permease
LNNTGDAILLLTDKNHDEDKSMPRQSFYGWKLLAALWAIVCINLAFPIYGARVLDAVMVEKLNLNRQTLGGIFSLYTLLSGIPGPLTALCVGRFGVRRTMFAGSLLVFIGSFLMATVVRSGLHAALAFGIVVGAGVAMGGVVGAQAGIAKWFVRRRALALAIFSTATGVGGFIASPLLNKVLALTDKNWRMGWGVIAALACIAALISIIFIKEEPKDLGQSPDGSVSDASGKNGAVAWRSRRKVYLTDQNWSYREVASDRSFWIMMVCHMGMGCGYLLFLGHGVVHLMDIGHTRDASSWAISLIALTSLIGKAIIAALGDRIEPRYIWAGFVAIFGVGMFLAVHAGSAFMLIAVASCLGIGFGGGVVCVATVLSNYYGAKVFASLIGLSLAISTTMGAIAPYVAGRLYDSGYGYQGVFYALALWCGIGAIGLFAVKIPVKAPSVKQAA